MHIYTHMYVYVYTYDFRQLQSPHISSTDCALVRNNPPVDVRVQRLKLGIVFSPEVMGVARGGKRSDR